MSHEKSHAAILIGASGSRTAESANTRNRSKSTRPTFYEGGVWERDYAAGGLYGNQENKLSFPQLMAHLQR